MKKEKVFLGEHGLEVNNQVDMFMLSIPEKYFSSFSDDKHLSRGTNVLNKHIFSYSKINGGLFFQREKPKFSIEQDVDDYAGIATVFYNETHKGGVISRLENAHVQKELNGSFENFVYDQALAIAEKFPLQNGESTIPYMLLHLGLKNYANDSSHVAVLNSLMYEKNELPHRLLGGAVYNHKDGEFLFNHSVIECEYNNKSRYVDPFYVVKLANEGKSKNEILRKAVDDIEHSFWELVKIQGTNEFTPEYRDEILNNSKIEF